MVVPFRPRAHSKAKAGSFMTFMAYPIGQQDVDQQDVVPTSAPARVAGEGAGRDGWQTRNEFPSHSDTGSLYGRDWSQLPDGVLYAIFRGLEDLHLVDTSQVCKAWRMISLSALRHLSPRGWLLGCKDHDARSPDCLQRSLLPLFHSIQHLSMIRCPESSERDIASALYLTTGLQVLRLHPESRVTLDGLGHRVETRMLLRKREGHPFPYPSVRVLDLGGCRNLAGAGAAASLAQLCQMLPCLASLNLRGCSGWVNAEVLKALPAAAPRLTFLDLSACHNMDDGALQAAVAGLPHLSQLLLNGCKRLFDDTLVALAIAAAPHGRLSRLGVAQGAWLSEPGLRGLAPLAGCLTSLDLSNNARLDRAALSGLSALVRLRRLSLQGCRDLTGSDLVLLAGLTSLECLDLRGLLVTAPTGVNNLRALSRLTSLALEGTPALGSQSSGVLAHVLAEARPGGFLASLVRLAFPGCQLQGGPACGRQVPLHERLQQATQLEALDLSGAEGVTPELLSAIAGLPRLRSLDLSLAGYSPSDGGSGAGEAITLASWRFGRVAAAAAEGDMTLEQAVAQLKGPSSLTQLSLCVGDLPGEQLARWLRAMPSLQRLGLSGHPMRCQVCTQDIASGLSGHTALGYLGLAGCCRVLRHLLPPRLKRAAAAADAHAEERAVLQAGLHRQASL